MATEFKEIPGLFCKNNAISEEQEIELVAWILSNPWAPVKASGREVQQYGAHYDYNTRTLGAATDMPKILIDLAKQLGLPKPENVIINKYEPGEGITSHTDNNIFW
jgi:alkylated DNA repair dioxygenase AlkB